ncbi:hypothetical protein [Streptomyces sp. NPDC046939]|uniref:hypothetical protein n=1 Tax=Streptomyces sp. NPDC046939 TaxID=3155376 RepID=UPI0033F05458
MHDRCRRELKDLPLAERGLVIRLTVRGFICGSADGPAGRSSSGSRGGARGRRRVGFGGDRRPDAMLFHGRRRVW